MPGGKKPEKFEDLPRRIQVFVDEYMKDFVALKAMRRAGVSNEHTARQQAHRWLNHPLVQQEIGRRLAIRFAENEVTVQRIVNELASIGFVELSRAEKILKSQNKIKALELLGKHLGMFTDKLDVSVQKSFEEKLDEIIGE